MLRSERQEHETASTSEDLWRHQHESTSEAAEIKANGESSGDRRSAEMSGAALSTGVTDAGDYTGDEADEGEHSALLQESTHKGWPLGWMLERMTQFIPIPTGKDTSCPAAVDHFCSGKCSRTDVLESSTTGILDDQTTGCDSIR